MADEPFFALWTVYKSPTDFPGRFVARRHLIEAAGSRATPEYVSSLTLEGVRNRLPRGLVRIPRDPTDDATIVEVWV